MALSEQSADALAGNRDNRRSKEEGRMGGGDDREDAPAAEPAAPPSLAMNEAVAPTPMQKSLGGLGARGSGIGGGGMGFGSIGAKGAGMAEKKKVPAKPRELKGLADKADVSGKDEGGEEAATRAWFPETFLFEPLVVTDANGQATVPVRVPDRLTNWRVLALAHSRQGSQAGAVTQFLGTLPTYIEPVVPAFLYAGDSVRLPMQVVNTTDRDVSATLKYQAVGATLSSAGGSVKVGSGGSTVDYVTLKTSTPGTVGVKAVLGTTDAVERTIEVKPAGVPVTVTHGGTLAGPREFQLTTPANALADSESLRLQVYPGALGLLRAELSAAPGRGGLAEDAYLLNLVGQAPALLKALGGEANADVIRDLTLIGTQRVMRYARSPSVDDATLLARAALAHPENPVLSRLAERLSMQIAQAQRPDGTCQGATGWTLQRLLVTTSDWVRTATAAGTSSEAVRRSTLMKVRAAGAIERNLARVNDPYTAAALLASGAASATAASALKAQVLAALVKGEDGAQSLPVGDGVVRSDGRVPSSIEATALAIIALKGDETAPLADLGTFLLSNYSPYAGWGDGRTNLVAMEAVLQLFNAPVPNQVKITLKRDGVVMNESDFNAQRLQDVVTLALPAKGSNGTHTWSLTAQPAVPGLGYALALTSYVKWVADPPGGLELTTTLPSKLTVGQPATVSLVAAAPGGSSTVLRLSLPAGVQPDATSLEGLISRRKVQRYETEDGAVTLYLTPFENGGALFQESLVVVPTLAGTLTSAPSTLKLVGRPSGRSFAPMVWSIAG